MKRNITLLLAALMIFTLLASCAGDQAPPSLSTYKRGTGGTTSSGNSGSGGSVIRNDGATEAKPGEIIGAMYVMIDVGMSYEDVCAIIGAEGKGAKRGQFMFYTWIGFGIMGNQVTMSFKDDILINKDPQSKNVGSGHLPTREEAEAELAAIGGDELLDLIDDAQDEAGENAEELGLDTDGTTEEAAPDAPAEEAAPELTPEG